MIEVEERYLTVGEIAEVLRVTPRTVYNWLESGELRGVRLGRTYRIPESNFKQFLEERGTGKGDRD